MLAERGPPSPPVPSFVPRTISESANKENALLTGRSSVRPLRSRRRRIRALIISPSVTAARRHRNRTARPQLHLSPDQVQMISTIPELPAAPTQRRLTLPRHLVRPKFRAVDPRAITSIDPELQNVPLGYILHVLQSIGPRLLQATCSAMATPPKGQLPRELQVTCNDVSVEPPTHVFAAYIRADASQTCGVTLFPAHSLVLSAICANLPVLPHSKPETPAVSGDTVTLPVVPLRIPSPRTFSALLSYLYTHNPAHILDTLLPLPIDGETMSLDQLARKHATSFTVKALLDHTQTVHELWSNVVALGVFDHKLFNTLQMIWEVLLSALSISLGRGLEAGLEAELEVG